MSKTTFTRTLSIKPDAEAGTMTLAALKSLVDLARAMQFRDDAEVYARPIGIGIGDFVICVTEH